MGIALKYEEQRCGYISEQTQIMMTAHDDVCSSNPEATFQTILEKCTLAKNIKKMYDDLCGTGNVLSSIILVLDNVVVFIKHCLSFYFDYLKCQSCIIKNLLLCVLNL